MADKCLSTMLITSNQSELFIYLFFGAEKTFLIWKTMNEKPFMIIHSLKRSTNKTQNTTEQYIHSLKQSTPDPQNLSRLYTVAENGQQNN